jgi:hypothetical protein
MPPGLEAAPLPSADLRILRELAKRKAAAAASPENQERRRLWLSHDAGRPERPMVLAEVFGVVDEVFPERPLRCRVEWARDVEWGLLLDLWQLEILKDDHVIEPTVSCNWKVGNTGYGVAAVQHRPDSSAGLGARRWDPPLKNLDGDFAKLKPRDFTVDRETTLRWKARLDEVFEGILPVEIRGTYWWTMGMTIVAIDLIGLEQLMLYMYDNPGGLHRLMAFLRDDHLAYARWLEREGLLSLNNRNDYIGSGSMGYTRELPQRDLAPGAPARCRDLWVLSESQETVGVGPELFAEFIFPYQKAVTDCFGRVYYGCCEPLHSRFGVIRSMTNLKRVSVSPWCDQDRAAESCGKAIAFSRKPKPTLISTEQFDEGAIRADLRATLAAARRGGCALEIIMKDVHTLHKEPGRLARWVEIAFEEIGR